MVYNWSNFIRSWLFPTRCRLCLAPGSDGLDICQDCLEELPWLDNACRTCALPLPDKVPGGRCAACLETPPVLDACHALFAYRPPVDQWIHSMKFRRDLAIARQLGELLSRHPGLNAPPADLQVLAVPLHPRRQRQRGYNQAQELARPLLGSGLARARLNCRRVHHTKAQSTLDADRRRRNLRGVFNVEGGAEGRRLLLIDDVLTTGATLNELAGTLKRAGASRVEALVVARTLPR